MTLLPVVKADYNFEVKAEGPSIFTVGRTETVNIYVHNIGSDNDSYSITFTKKAQDQSLNSVPQLVQVSLFSNKTHNLTQNEQKSTFALITLIGPVQSGNVTFTIFSNAQPTNYREVSVKILSGMPVNLPEFGWLGLIEILILVSLILISTDAPQFR
jgi:uncharacterized protein YfaS (alpha-2-macroglobulin family)